MIAAFAYPFCVTSILNCKCNELNDILPTTETLIFFERLVMAELQC